MANASASHVFVSGIADDAASQAAGEVLPSHWNASHTVAAGGSTTEVQVNSGGAIVGSPFFTFDSGQMAIGNASALGGGSLYGNYPPIVIDIEATYTVDPPSGYLQGLVSVIKSNFGAPSTASVYALYFKADNATANVVNSLYGVTGYATGNVTNVVVGGSFIGEATAGSPSQVIGAYCYAINIGLGTSALAAGLFVDSTTNSGGGSITDACGITVADQIAGINNWSIKTGLGKVQFGDNLILGAVSSKTGVLQLANSASANLTSIQAGNAAASITYTLPTNVGAAGTFLKDAAGNGVLSWAAPAGSGTVTHTGGALTSGSLVVGAGSDDIAVTTTGTGIVTALGVNVGSSGAPVINGGALGTPSSGTLTNCGSLPVAGITASTSTALGVGSIELGHASDTTIARSGAGDITIEGKGVYRADGTDVAIADGGTGSSTAAGAIANLGGLPLAGGTMSGAITMGENTSVALDPAGSADGKYSGITVTGTGGATIAFGDLITLDKDDSRWELVDISVAAAATGDARGILGMAVTSSTDGGALTILLNGIIRADANFPTLTIGAAVFASTTGDVVVTQPTTTDHVIRIIGYGLTGDEMYFNPGTVWTTHT